MVRRTDLRALPASLVLALIWAAWHLPLIWTEGRSLFGHPVWLLFLDLAATSVKWLLVVAVLRSLTRFETLPALQTSPHGDD